MLKYQDQNTDMTVLEGIKEYREYLVQNNKDKLRDFEGSQLIRDHDATHVIFGLDTTIEQESMLDTWVLWGTEFKWKYLLSYIGKQELKELQKKSWNNFSFDSKKISSNLDDYRQEIFLKN